MKTEEIDIRGIEVEFRSFSDSDGAIYFLPLPFGISKNKSVSQNIK